MKKYKHFLGIVIPTYNRLKFLEKCLNSIGDTCIYEYIIYIVIDCNRNDPSEDAIIELAKKYENTKIVRTPFNYGVGVCRYAGTKAAIEDKCKYVLNTDDDCKLEADNFKTLVTVMEKDKAEEIGVASTPFGGRFRVYNHDLRISGKTYVEAPTATGAFAIARAYVLDAIGNYDTLLPFKEDIELCYRVWIYGKKCVMVTKCEVKHTGSQSGGLDDTAYRKDSSIKSKIDRHVYEKYGGFLTISKNGNWVWWNKFKHLDKHKLQALREMLFKKRRFNSE